MSNYILDQWYSTPSLVRYPLLQMLCFVVQHILEPLSLQKHLSGPLRGAIESFKMPQIRTGCCQSDHCLNRYDRRGELDSYATKRQDSDYRQYCISESVTETLFVEQVSIIGALSRIVLFRLSH